MTLYLASQSPRRRQLLAQIGITPVLLLPEGEQEAHAAEALARQRMHEHIIRSMENMLTRYLPDTTT